MHLYTNGVQVGFSYATTTTLSFKGICNPIVCISIDDIDSLPYNH